MKVMVEREEPKQPHVGPFTGASTTDSEPGVQQVHPLASCTLYYDFTTLLRPHVFSQSP